MDPVLEDHVRDFVPTATLETLRIRAHVLDSVRQHFRDSGYFEVETPLLSRDTSVDVHLEPYSVPAAPGEGQTTSELFLQTSPEFGMKRLLAAGAQAIFQICRVARRGESGRLHNPEFTMIEWYRAGDTYRDQMRFTESLVRSTVAASDDATGMSHHLGSAPFAMNSFDEAFARLAGARVLESSTVELRSLAEQHALSAPDSLQLDDRDGWLNLLLSHIVEPHLGQSHPEFIYDYPDSQAALARIRLDQPPVAERFELYIDGIEICNGYDELTDADELRQRIAQQNQLRLTEGRRALPTDSRLLDAMDCGLPRCSGVALGFDRLLMLGLRRTTIDDVIAFPISRA
ncbi:MAG: EF-P lysine aminoacylase EpmA [Planctomycetaceae bacterium]